MNKVEAELFRELHLKLLQATQRSCQDALTGLPNRAVFSDRLPEVLKAEANLLALLFLDVDHFKQINDALGHVTGDRLLQEVAARLKTCLRPWDTLTRWGGDEFTLILPHLTTAQEAETICQQILEVFQPPFLEAQQFITISIGVALFPQDGPDGPTLLQHADDALYRAKKSRNTYCFYSPRV